VGIPEKKEQTLKTKLFVLITLLAMLIACRFTTPQPILEQTEPADNALPGLSTRQAATPAPGKETIPNEGLLATALPPGYYSSSAGFSLVVPDGWKITEELAGGTIYVENETTGAMVSLEGGYSGDNCDFDYIRPLVRSSYEEYLSDIQEEDFPDGSLSDGTPLQQTQFRGQNENGIEFIIRLSYAEHGPLCYLFTTVVQQEALADTAGLDELFASLQLGSQQVLGVPRSQAVVMLSTDPTESILDPALSVGGAYGPPGLSFSGLVRLSPQLQIEPDLAQDWTVNEDGTTYTFTLKENLKFADGSPLTAEDVRYSLERAADPKTGSSVARTYLGDIQGVKEKLDGKAQEISGLKVLDERTLEIKLDGPKPYFLAKLTYPTGFVVDRRDVENDPQNWFYSPNASGPFVFQSYKEGDGSVYASNPNYHTPPKLPYVVYLYNRMGDMLSFYQAGEIDLAYPSVDQVLEIQDPAHPFHSELHNIISMCTTYLAFSNTSPPMDDANFRKALALSIDRSRLAKLFSKGLSLPAEAFFPPAMPGFNPSLPPISFDVTQAKAALAASSYAQNPREILLVDSGYAGESNPYVDALIEMWETNLGIDVRLVLVDPLEHSTALREQQGDIVPYGWCADYPDPENFLDILFHSKSEFNITGYSNPQVDELLVQARTELDPARRIELYQQAEALLLQDGAGLPMEYEGNYTLVSPRLLGWVDSPMNVPIFHLLELKQP
jgi:ABC-type transport system substrate-binding protein